MAGNGGVDLGKRQIWLFIVGGVFFFWIGLILAVLVAGDVAELGVGLAFTGILFAFAVALAGALGSQRTSDQQNLGLLILAAALILASVSVI